MMGGTTALILAGGRGKRMDVLCYERPKPVLPFGGQYQVIDFSLSNCLNSGITNIAALTDYQGRQMAGYLRDWESANRGLAGIDILPPSCGSYKGTADAVYQNLEYLRSQQSDRVMILAGDHVYQMDYRQMLAFHEAVRADVTVGVIKVPAEETHRFGTVSMDDSGRIQKFIEKKPQQESCLASMGIYIFNRDILSKRLKEDADQADSPHDFGYAILPGMIQRDRVFAYEFSGYWQDIGTIEAYYEANLGLLEPEPLFDLYGRNRLYSIYRDHSGLENAGEVINSLISPGCVVRGKVENSILSPGVYVAEKAVVRNSIIMSNSVIGYHSVVDRSIIDEEVEIGEFCYTGFDTGIFPEKHGITVLGKGALVPAYTGIGRKCKIEPQARPADFRGRLIRSGSLVASVVNKPN